MLLTQHGNKAKSLSPSPFFGLEIQRELTEQGSFAKILNLGYCIKLECQARSEFCCCENRLRSGVTSSRVVSIVVNYDL